MDKLQELTTSQTSALKKDELLSLLNGTLRELVEKTKEVTKQNEKITEQNNKLSEEFKEQFKGLEDKVESQNEKITEQNEMLLEQIRGIEGRVETTLNRMERDITYMSNNLHALSEDAQKVQDRVGTLETKLDQMHELPAKVEQLDTRIEDIIEEKVKEKVKEELKDMYEILVSQQKFLEQVDAEKRGRNLVFYGIQEGSTDLGSDDIEKVKKVIEKTKLNNAGDMDNLQVRRLGAERDDSKPRPLFVSVETHKLRKDILLHAKNLKDEAGCSRIYIKKDIHPCVRKERDRLLKREKEEKQNPANEGINIKYDWDGRVLRRDGVIIDRYRPSF